MTTPPLTKDDLKSFLMGSLSNEIRNVKLEVRPVASLTVRDEWVMDVLDEVEKRGVRHSTFGTAKGYTQVYLFIRAHLYEVIQFNNNRSYDAQTLRIWIEGKIHGYSEGEIETYLQEGS